MNQQNSDVPIGSAVWQNLFGIARVILFLLISWGFAAYASVHFHGINPVDVAAGYRKTLPWLFGFWPDSLLAFFAMAVNAYGWRYLIVPLLTTLIALVAAALYIKDIYELPDIGIAFQYVVASMFAIGYPKLQIDKGVPQLKKKEPNLIDKIGGPGFVLVEPGSAAMFRHLRRASRSVLPTTYFLAPFENIAHTIDLAEQQGDIDEVGAVTRDGIQVKLRDVHLRFRIKQREQNGSSVRRTLADPYPLENDAMNHMMSNLTVDENGLGQWTEAVVRVVTGAITDFIAGHNIDYLTAPRSNQINPRVELRSLMFFRAIRGALGQYGAELLWIDVGHIDINAPIVDDRRTDLWAADWVGDANVSQAYGEARRLAYQELGRAEAQAELILSVSDALAEINPPGEPGVNVRKLLLARTAQILDALRDKAQLDRDEK